MLIFRLPETARAKTEPRPQSRGQAASLQFTHLIVCTTPTYKIDAQTLTIALYTCAKLRETGRVGLAHRNCLLTLAGWLGGHHYNPMAMRVRRNPSTVGCHPTAVRNNQ